MRIRVSIAALLSVIPAGALAQTPLTTQVISNAIEMGRTGTEDRLLVRCRATVGFLNTFRANGSINSDVDRYSVTISLTAGRIALLAADAKRLYKGFTPSDVPAELRTDALFIDAIPMDVPPGTTRTPSAIEHVVVKAKNGSVVQPAAVRVEPIDWPTAPVSSAILPPRRALARFDIGTIEELPAGDLDVVLITPNGERKCKIEMKDRERLLPIDRRESLPRRAPTRVETRGPINRSAASRPFTAVGTGQTLKPAQIEDAVAAVVDRKKVEALVFTCPAVVGWGSILNPAALFGPEKTIRPLGGYSVTLSLTTGRIALLAADAARFYRKFDPATVPPDLKTLEVVVTADPFDPSINSNAELSDFIKTREKDRKPRVRSAPTADVTPPIEQVTIADWPFHHKTVTPSRIKIEPIEWPNVLGSHVKGTRAEARFSLGAVRELAAGYLSIRLTTPAGDRTCDMTQRDRTRIFGVN